jgi:hypothetical protein
MADDFFTELNNNARTDAENKVIELKYDYLNIIRSHIVDEEFHLQPDISSTVVFMGECKTDACEGVLDKLVDKRILESMGSGFQLTRIVHKEKKFDSTMQRLGGMVGLPLKLKNHYTFSYDIKWGYLNKNLTPTEPYEIDFGVYTKKKCYD